MRSFASNPAAHLGTLNKEDGFFRQSKAESLNLLFRTHFAGCVFGLSNQVQVENVGPVTVNTNSTFFSFRLRGLNGQWTRIYHIKVQNQTISNRFISKHCSACLRLPTLPNSGGLLNAESVLENSKYAIGLFFLDIEGSFDKVSSVSSRRVVG